MNYNFVPCALSTESLSSSLSLFFFNIFIQFCCVFMFEISKVSCAYTPVCTCVCVGKVRSRADVRHVCMSSFFFLFPELDWDHEHSSVGEYIYYIYIFLLGKGPVVSIQSTFSPPATPLCDASASVGYTNENLLYMLYACVDTI